MSSGFIHVVAYVRTSFTHAKENILSAFCILLYTVMPYEFRCEFDKCEADDSVPKNLIRFVCTRKGLFLHSFL